MKRRLALTLSGFFVGVFLLVYFLINSATPNDEDRKPNFMLLQTQMHELEQDFRKHGNRMQNLIEQLQRAHDSIQSKRIPTDQQSNQIEQQQTVSTKFKPATLSSIFFGQPLEPLGKPFAVNVGPQNGSRPMTQCQNDFQQVPKPNIQMLDMYQKMSFIDKDGGVWKQGWDIKYDPLQFNGHHKLKVFVVPHSHNDPGWIKTFDDYYEHETVHILSNAIRHLRDNPDMKFIWAEISYFSRFYEHLSESNRLEVKKLVKNGQLEFVTGGWVMPDEANSHWLSLIMQLTEGHLWLKEFLNVTPTSSWSIDPFGHSPTMPYILKKSGFENLLIQRTHYSVKKELALQRQLEFNWRPLWDNSGDLDLFTHMMPFYSYDIPHSCGPDPKICCQFDFKRMPNFGLSCPWRISPQTITEDNVVVRAELLVDQWKKKSQLYRTNVLLFPLGDDFRYSQSTEWEVQRVNYEFLFNHINNERQYFVEAQFGTLQEYFNAVRQEFQQRTELTIPTLSGDFFTYADRSDNYWSGYYTSRPFHKRMDRVLLHYIRSAEMLNAWCHWTQDSRSAKGHFNNLLQEARRELSLFQHHDGITGTSKNHVMKDYMRRMSEAINISKFIMQQAVYQLLTKPSVYRADLTFHYFYLDDARWPGSNINRTTIILGDELPFKHLVFHNSLPQVREELVNFYVASPFVSVVDGKGLPIICQISPVWSWHKHTLTNTITPQALVTKYGLIFKVRVPPLGLSTYTVRIDTNNEESSYRFYATNIIMGTTPVNSQLGEYPHEVKTAKYDEVSLKSGKSYPQVVFTKEGFMKSIKISSDEDHIPIRLQFLKYQTRRSGEYSGAYLFLPQSVATNFYNTTMPVILVTEGVLESSISSGWPFGVHETILRDGDYPEIRNHIDISDMDDTELVMRFQTNIQNDNTFFTDLNGLQMIRRKYLEKLPLQANYYPIPTAIYIENNLLRLTVVSAQPLGGSSLSLGQIEIMQDRRLTHDDDRGLGHGVLDNKPVLHIFRVILEPVSGCQKLSTEHPMGALTVSAYQASKALLYPLNKFIFSQNEWIGAMKSFGENRFPLEEDIELVTMRLLQPPYSSAPFLAKERMVQLQSQIGLTLHRTKLLQCRRGFFRETTGMVNVSNLLQPMNIMTMHKTTLTFLERLEMVKSPQEIVSLCPMDTQSFVLKNKS